MYKCQVCSHPEREAIEAALFKMPSENATEALLRIAKEFDIPPEELQKHFLMHSSFGSEESIVRQIKIREADLLSAMAFDQLETVKAVGKRMRRFVGSSDADDVRFEKTLTKSVVDLYIGAGECLRKNVQTLADINQLLNGPKDEGSSGLSALAKVIEESRKNSKDNDHD